MPLRKSDLPSFIPSSAYAPARVYQIQPPIAKCKAEVINLSDHQRTAPPSEERNTSDSSSDLRQGRSTVRPLHTWIATKIADFDLLGQRSRRPRQPVRAGRKRAKTSMPIMRPVSLAIICKRLGVTSARTPTRIRSSISEAPKAGKNSIYHNTVAGAVAFRLVE